jgi:hypothetical protein
MAHLDHLGRDTVRDGATYRIICLYCEASDYTCTGGAEEGISCVDDAARAAVARPGFCRVGEPVLCRKECCSADARCQQMRSGAEEGGGGGPYRGKKA